MVYNLFHASYNGPLNCIPCLDGPLVVGPSRRIQPNILGITSSMPHITGITSVGGEVDKPLWGAQNSLITRPKHKCALKNSISPQAKLQI